MQRFKSAGSARSEPAGAFLEGSTNRCAYRIGDQPGKGIGYQLKKRPQEPHRIVFKPPVIFVRFQRSGLRAWARRLGDLAAACALIAFTLPLMAIVAIAIKCDSPGPVFERRQCVGIGGRRFDALSFRTTLHAAEDADLAWHRAPQ